MFGGGRGQRVGRVHRRAAGVRRFSDLFDAFFGGTAAGGAARRGRAAVGSDLRYDLRVSFEESNSRHREGIEFSPPGPCATCSGAGAKAGSAAIACRMPGPG